MENPVQCSLLYNTPVKFFIKDILNLTQLPENKGLFIRNGHLINKVELFAIITSVQQKESSIFCSLDDGTGTIGCFLDFRKSPDVSPENQILRRLIKQWDTKPNIGAFVRVHGAIKHGLWNNCIYISSSNWSISNTDTADVDWLAHINEQKQLYSEVYDKEFAGSLQLQDILKSMFINECNKLMLNQLEPVLNSIIVNFKLLPSHFYGYEILELEEVKKISADILTKKNEKCTISKSQVLKMSIQGISSILHSFVTSGQIIKKKCLKHEVVVRNDQMDAQYFITCKTNQVLSGVRTALNKIGQTSNGANSTSTLRAFNVPGFNFIRSSKHGVSIIEKALQEIQK